MTFQREVIAKTAQTLALFLLAWLIVQASKLAM